MDFSMGWPTITPKLESWFKRPLSKLPREVRPIAEAYIPGWPDLTPRQREERAKEIDRQQEVKLRIKLERFRRQRKRERENSDPKEMQAEFHIGYYGDTHVQTWLAMGAVAPQEAALLFFGKNPFEFKDRLPFMGDEFNLMQRTFEDAARDGLPRNLRDWLSVARARNLHGVAIDGWEACIAVSARYASEQSEAMHPVEPVINAPATDTAMPAPEPASPESEKWRLFWRSVRFDENRVEAAMGELERFDTKDVSEIAFRDKKLAALTANLAQIEGRKDELAVQMGAPGRLLAERSFAVAVLAESRRPLDTKGIIARSLDTELANKEIDALIAKRTAPLMGLADASGGVKPDKAGPDDKKPWLVADSTDPIALNHWYTPARYFARQLVLSDSTLLNKKLVLADKVSQSLYSVGIYKRGGKKRHAADTVLKAFSNVSLG